MEKQTKLVNLTPHEVTIYDENGNVKLRIPPSGQVARVKSRQVKIGEINGIPVFKTEFYDIEGLPDPQPDTVYIVSLLVLQACRDRKDLVAPDTSPQGAVRDSEGKIIGTRGFQVL